MIRCQLSRRPSGLPSLPLGGLGHDYADYVAVAYELARGNGATALVFNMHASVTGALAGIPDELARSLGVGDEFFDSRDRILTDAARGALFAVAMSERGAGSRLSQLSTRYEAVDGGFHIKGPLPTTRSCRSSSCRPARKGLPSSKPGTRWECDPPRRMTCTST